MADKMREVVPEKGFSSFYDFMEWGKTLKPEYIQSFSTKEWLQIYEKIDDFVENNKEFDKYYRENVATLINYGLINGTVENALDSKYINYYKKLAFVQFETGDIICQLNRNYRFEKEHFEVISQLGKKAGEKLADRGFDSARFTIKTKDGNSDELLGMAINVNNITVGQTAYAESRKPYFSTRVEVDDNMLSTGLAKYGSGNDRILAINSNFVRDNGVHVAFHEAAHIHMQNGSYFLENMFKEGVVAIPELGEDFYKLLQKNKDYYILPERASRGIDGSLYAMFSENEVKRININAFNSYHKQPMEKFSEIYGIEAERSFRRKTGMTSERNALKLSDQLSWVLVSEDEKQVVLGRPCDVMRGSNGINLYYKVDGISPDIVEKSLLHRLDGLDEETLKKMNICKTYNGSISVTVPSKWEDVKNFEKFFSKSMALPPLPSVNMQNVGENISPNAISFEEFKTLEQKMNDRVDVRAPHKAVSKESVEKAAEEAQKRKGIIDRSIDAVKKFNDRVDDKIGDVIEKGSKALNETQIGKVYLKSEKAVLDTKAVKGIKGVWNKAGKVIGDSAIAKGFKKAGAKLGGKVAAKVGGKAVVKSVVKKIPIISAAAGVGFAVDRCFKGEWVAAGGELLSGVAGCFPGLGTAASVAIDVGLAANDISNAVNDENKTSSVREHAIAEARVQKSVKDVQKEIAERGEILRQEGRLEGNKGKSKVTATKISQEQIVAQKTGRG